MARRPSGLRIDNPAWVLVQLLCSYWGITDADGAALGATLLCGDLVNQPDFDGNHVVIIDGAYGGQARDISGVTTAGVVTPASNFGGVILAGTTFAILPIRTTPAEVAALTALVVALGGVPTEATYAHPNGVGESIAFTTPAPTPLSNRVFIMLDLSNLTQNADIRIKYDMHGDGAPFPTIETFNWTVGMDDIVYFREISGQRAVQVTVQSALAEGAARDIDYEYVLG